MSNIELHSQQIISGILQIIETARKQVAVYVNSETTLLYYEIGKYLRLLKLMTMKLLRHCRNI